MKFNRYLVIAALLLVIVVVSSDRGGYALGLWLERPALSKVLERIQHASTPATAGFRKIRFDVSGLDSEGTETIEVFIDGVKQEQVTVNAVGGLAEFRVSTGYHDIVLHSNMRVKEYRDYYVTRNEVLSSHIRTWTARTIREGKVLVLATLMDQHGAPIVDGLVLVDGQSIGSTPGLMPFPVDVTSHTISIRTWNCYSAPMDRARLAGKMVDLMSERPPEDAEPVSLAVRLVVDNEHCTSSVPDMSWPWTVVPLLLLTALRWRSPK